MFRNTFQSGFLSILYSLGSKPLEIWQGEGEGRRALSTMYRNGKGRADSIFVKHKHPRLAFVLAGWQAPIFRHMLSLEWVFRRNNP
jgi:hypothetical protein